METGKDRVRALFKRRPGEQFMLEEVREFQATVLVATLTGFLLGGLVGARYAGDKFVRISQSSKFSSTMQAQRELHTASFLGFTRNGCRWGWKLGVFSAIFSGTNILLSTYRDTSDALNYIAAGGNCEWISLQTTLRNKACHWWNGVGHIIKKYLIPTCSVPVGVFMHGLERGLVSQDQRDEIRKRKYDQYRLRQLQWESRLGSTARLIEGLEQELESPGSRPLSSTSCETEQMTSTAKDDVQS
ncbi:Complex I assembly factor TIMMDC1, mitochondrial [Geodia barretti]|nr:Complex I assembly factor TIMMDC1, mitochondrial [Geodia barretti]